MKAWGASSTRSAQHEAHFPDGVYGHAPYTSRAGRWRPGNGNLVLSRPEAHGLTIQWTAPALQLAQHLVVLRDESKALSRSKTGTSMRSGCGALSTAELPHRSS